MHSEVHNTFFTSLGIPASPIKEPFRARVWPVLTRDKNAQKETLVQTKNQAQPNLPLCIRITGPTIDSKVDWTPSSAWADLTQRLELELEEKILRFKLSLTDQPRLEWVWSDELSRGGMECTILAHIDTGSSALSVQNKRHLQWKVLDNIASMNNNVEFAAPAHNLLKKLNGESSARQAHKNSSASLMASPQAARKKRYTKLTLCQLMAPQKESSAPTDVCNGEEGEAQEPSISSRTTHPGSFSQPAARNKLLYD
jgi:hypothetical protein